MEKAATSTQAQFFCKKAFEAIKAMVDQIMAADKLRLKSQLGTLSKTDLLAVEDAIKMHLALPR